MAVFVNQFPQSHYAALSIQLYAVGTAQRNWSLSNFCGQFYRHVYSISITPIYLHVLLPNYFCLVLYPSPYTYCLATQFNRQYFQVLHILEFCG